MSAQTTKVLVLVADGTEEMEAVITVDILRRAQNIQVTVAACQHSNPSFVMCSRGVRLVPDCDLDSLNERSLVEFDMLVLPGGLGGAKLFSQVYFMLRNVAYYFEKLQLYS
jgi:protein DJ-1